MKKVYSSFEEMMAVIRGKVEEYVPEKYIEPFEPEEEKPKKRRRKKEEE